MDTLASHFWHVHDWSRAPLPAENAPRWQGRCPKEWAKVVPESIHPGIDGKSALPIRQTPARPHKGAPWADLAGLCSLKTCQLHTRVVGMRGGSGVLPTAWAKMGTQVGTVSIVQCWLQAREPPLDVSYLVREPLEGHINKK